MNQQRPTIAVLATHARRVPIVDRERFAARLRESIARDGLVIETCHRVEGYAASEEGVARLRSFDRPPGTRELEGEPAIRHAIAVAAGLDSVVVGEDQVVHQIRTAVDAARAAGAMDPILERLFAAALRAGRRARSWRRGPERSLATVALSEIERRSGPLRGRSVLIVGAGRMGRLAARAATDIGASVAVANRSTLPAQGLAKDVGADVVAFDPGPGVGRYAAVIVALAGPWPLGPSTSSALADGSVCVVDLSVPSALDGDLALSLEPRLITADDLARIDSATEQPDERHAQELDALIEGATADFVAWLDGHGRRATAAALAQRADLAREAELAALWRRLPELDPEARAAIDSMSRHLADRLLREPMERLGRDRDGHAERAVRETFAL